jgi:hypothetical protein
LLKNLLFGIKDKEFKRLTCMERKEEIEQKKRD